MFILVFILVNTYIDIQIDKHIAIDINGYSY